MPKVGLDDAFAAGAKAEDLIDGASDAPPPTDGPSGAEKNQSQGSRLVDLAQEEDAELFHDADDEPYLTLTRNGHQETHRLHSKAIRHWLGALYFEQFETAPANQALQDALNTLAGIARFQGERRPVFVRRAGHADAIYLDLGNDAWEVVEITAGGWSVISAAAAPVRFRRPKGMRELPTPVSAGDITRLRRFINVRDEDAFILIVAWLLGALRPKGPYPILVFSGEQGTAKSTGARILRALIDPHTAPLRSEPREEGDLLIAAVNGLVVALDNLSRLSE